MQSTSEFVRLVIARHISSITGISVEEILIHEKTRGITEAQRARKDGRYTADAQAD